MYAETIIELSISKLYEIELKNGLVGQAFKMAKCLDKDSRNELQAKIKAVICVFGTYKEGTISRYLDHSNKFEDDAELIKLHGDPISEDLIEALLKELVEIRCGHVRNKC